MPKYLDGEGLSYFWGKIKSLFTNVVYHESDDGSSGEASIPSSDANIIEIVKVNGNPLTPDANKAVDVQVPTNLSQLLPDSTHRVVTDTEKTNWNNKGTYTKPINGIPASDLEDGVIPINVSDFINDAGYLTQHQSLANYVQKSQTAGLLKNDGTVDTNTYLTQHQSLSGYATTQDLEDSKVFWAEVDVTTFAEIQDAIDAGRTVMLKDEDDYIYRPSYYYRDDLLTFSLIESSERYIKAYVVYYDDTWDAVDGGTIEFQNNRVSSISSSSDDGHYPTAKAVWDIVSAKYTKPQTGIPASDLASGVIPTVPVQDVTVGGTSVVSNGTAVIPQADWNASSGVAQILNKPTIPLEDLIVTITLDEGSLITGTANYSTSQIATEFGRGRKVYLRHEEAFIPAVMITSEYVVYSFTFSSTLLGIKNLAGAIQEGTTVSLYSYTFDDVAFDGESDPVFTNSPAYGITSNDITNWNNKGTYTKPSGGIPDSDIASASTWNAKYSKPSGGIPASDLASGVIPTIPTNVSSFTNDAGYLTQHQDISGKADKTSIVSLVGSTITQELADNTIYQGSTLSSLTISIPNNTTSGYISQINFASGSTATTLTAPNTIVWFGDDLANDVFVPITNRQYIVMFYSDGVNIRGIVQSCTITV